MLRHVNPALTGEDLIKLGVPKGPKIKEVLQRLREARLDGKIDEQERGGGDGEGVDKKIKRLMVNYYTSSPWSTLLTRQYEGEGKCLFKKG